MHSKRINVYSILHKTKESLRDASDVNMWIIYKLENSQICNQGICFKNAFVLVKNMDESIILGTPFLTQNFPFKVATKGIYPLKFCNLYFKFALPPITKNCQHYPRKQNIFNRYDEKKSLFIFFKRRFIIWN